MAKKTVVLQAIADVIGHRSSAYRDLMKAIESGDELSLMLCHQELDALPHDKKVQLADRVRVLEAEEAAADDPGTADFDDEGQKAAG